MTLTEEQLMNIRKFLVAVVPIIFKYNCSVTSWIRSEKRNVMVKGHIRSQHIAGTAIDIVPDNPNDRDQIIQEALELGYVGIKYGLLPHVHIQMFNAR